MIDTAGTMTTAAQLIKDKGAKTVRAIATHAVLSGPAYDRINNSLLEELVVSDTIPLKQESDKIKVLSFSELFARAISNVVTHDSISSLFI
jgi:ribose-phosphate pyrophosphokinase